MIECDICNGSGVDNLGRPCRIHGEEPGQERRDHTREAQAARVEKFAGHGIHAMPHRRSHVTLSGLEADRLLVLLDRLTLEALSGRINR